jgi:hypothetical protein
MTSHNFPKNPVQRQPNPSSLSWVPLFGESSYESGSHMSISEHLAFDDIDVME